MLRIISFLVFFSLLGSCRTNPGKQDSRQPALQDSLTIALADVDSSRSMIGFAAAIVGESGILYKRGFGFSDLEKQERYTDTTIQNIASISKLFIGVAVLKAQELGLLKLDDPVNLYLPFRVQNPRFTNAVITIRQLVTHTSGILDNQNYFLKDYYLEPGIAASGYKSLEESGLYFNAADSAVSLEKLLRNLLIPEGRWYRDDVYAGYPPGTKFSYSNTGATLAAYIVERVSKQSFDIFTTRYILTPLEMNATGWKRDKVSASAYSSLYHDSKMALPAYSMSSYPDGNLITSVTDLSRFLQELIKASNGRGTLLADSTYKLYFTGILGNQNSADGNPFSDEYNMGVFLGISPMGYLGHTGSDPGVSTKLFFDPKTGRGAILLANTSWSKDEQEADFEKAWNLLWEYQKRFVP